MFVVANRLKDLRESEGITIEEMAKKTGKSVATIYRYERGMVEKIPYDTLTIIAKALGKSPEELRGDDVRKAIAEEDRECREGREVDEVSRLDIVNILTDQKYKFNQLDLSQIKSFIEYIIQAKKYNKRY